MHLAAISVIISSDTNRSVDRYLYFVTIVSLVLKDDLTGLQAGTGFVSTRKYSIQLLYLYVYVYVYI